MPTPQCPPSHNGHSNGSDETPDRPEPKTFRLNPEIFPSSDITEFARGGSMRPAIMCAGAAQGAPQTGALPRLIRTMARGLARGHSRHLLVTGQRGVGKPTLVPEL